MVVAAEWVHAKGVMIAPRRLASLALVALTAACGRSDSSTTAALGVATIGPAGGILVVDRGQQQGLVLEVPAGAVARPTEFRVAAEGGGGSPSAPTGSGIPAVAAPLRIEPTDLVSPVSMRLRIPYEPANVSGTGAGNIDVRQKNAALSRDYDPEDIDAVAGWVEISVKTLGRFEVVVAPTPADLLSYLPPVGEVASLEDGFAFTVEPEPVLSPLSGLDVLAWSVVGPSFFEQIVVGGASILGRRSGALWAEEWSIPYDPFGDPGEALANMITQTAAVTDFTVFSIVSAAVTPLGYFQYALPIRYDEQLYTDIGQLVVNVAYDRPDLGVGERQVTMWLSPEVGLLRLAVDGVSYDRVP